MRFYNHWGCINLTSYIEMSNSFGTIVTLCSVGASIYDIKTPDKNNNNESILYTVRSQTIFPFDNSYYGKTIGRTGGRISGSKFKLNGKEYVISSTDPNGLHGGKEGLSFKEFNHIKKTYDDYTEVEFSYYSKNMESGYPGNLDIKVIYRLYNNVNKLTLRYLARCDEDTLLNLSNHSYFNLSGNAKDNILNHNLYINASKMEKIEKLLPKCIVECDKIYSFKDGHKIGDYLKSDEIINNTNGYDYPYIFDECGLGKDNIILSDKKSGRILKVKTTYPVVVIYTCNYTGEEIMNNNKVATPYYAVCLECMYHPNTINSDFLSDKKDILKSGSRYDETIEYYFEVEND